MRILTVLKQIANKLGVDDSNLNNLNYDYVNAINNTIPNNPFGTFELIRSYTVDELKNEHFINKDSEGNNFSLTDITVTVQVEPTLDSTVTNDANVSCYFKVGNAFQTMPTMTAIPRYGTSLYTTCHYMYGYHTGFEKTGVIKKGGTGTTSVGYNVNVTTTLPIGNVTEVKFSNYVSSSVQLPIGTVTRIYGKRV